MRHGPMHSVGHQSAAPGKLPNAGVSRAGLKLSEVTVSRAGLRPGWRRGLPTEVRTRPFHVGLAWLIKRRRNARRERPC